MNIGIPRPRRFAWPSLPWLRPDLVRFVVEGSIAFLSGLLLYMFTSDYYIILVAGLAVVALIVLLIWRYPIQATLALIFIAPAHPFIMMLIYHWIGSPIMLKVAQSWKEIVVLTLLARVVQEAFLQRRTPRVKLLDLLIIFYMVLTASYLGYPGRNSEASFIDQLYGIRTDSFFFFAYFVGRGLPLKPHHARHLLIAFAAIGVIVAGFAVLQFAAPGISNNLFNTLGFTEFMTQQRAEASEIRFAVRSNELEGFLLPRASSLLLSDLALAFYGVFAVAVMASIMAHARGLRERLLGTALLFSMIGATSLSVTRAAIGALLPVLGFVFLVRRSVFSAWIVLIAGLIAGAGVLMYMDMPLDAITNYLSFQEGSSQGHMNALETSWTLAFQEPFGRGLATAGTVAQRFSPETAINNESWYFQIATEIGIGGALLFAAILALFLFYGLARYGSIGDRWRRALALGMVAAAIGMGLIGMFHHAWESLTTSIVFWLLAGVVVSMRPETKGLTEERVNAHRHLP